jgi:iron complex transport system substrate-binding protein
MKKLTLFLIAAILLIFTAACGKDSTNGAMEKNDNGGKGAKAEELTIKHQLGDTKIKPNPEKVVVFDFGVLDSLDQLNIEVTGVPQTNIPAYLSKYEDQKYENVGSLKEPDFEKIAEIDPDLIIISGRQQELYEEFAEIAPTVYMGLDTSKYMESFTENMKILGEVFDKESEVEKEIASIEESITGLKEKTINVGNSLVILANEGNLSAYGPGSRFGVIHDVFGLKAVDESIEISPHGQSISPEYLAEKDPDYLFVVDRGTAVGGESSAKSIVETDLVKNKKAYKNGHIVYLNPDYWYLSGGGLQSVAEMIKEIEEGIE